MSDVAALHIIVESYPQYRPVPLLNPKLIQNFLHSLRHDPTIDACLQ